MNSLFIPIIGYADTTKLNTALATNYHISETILSELVGHNAALLARELLQGKKNVLVLAGPGRNGTEALATARHLHSTGHATTLFLTDEPTTIPGQAEKVTIQKIGIPIATYQEVDNVLQQSDLVIDGLAGSDLQGNPKGMMELIIGLVNLRQKPVLSIDVPTGYELRTGLLRQPHIKAAATLCTGLVKEGLDEEFSGDIYAVNVGIPPKMYEELGVEFNHERFFGVVKTERKNS